MIDDTPGLVIAEKAMNGIEFLKERKKQGIKIPVIILSSIARRGAEITMEALSLGASDFIQKPSGSVSEDIHTVKDTLMGMLLGYGGTYRRSQGKKVLSPAEYAQQPNGAHGPDITAHLNLSGAPAGVPAKPPAQIRKPGKTEIIALGISTGGPDALRIVFAKLDPDLKVPIVVVQHMPPGFTNEFAKSLDRICPLAVKEAEEGDVLQPGRILIAQGNKHLEVEKKPLASIVHLSDAPQVSGHRPSADVLFASVAMAFQNHSLGVIMTGMGRDGAQQLGTIYKEGGMTIGQDEASAVVYGMPRVAYELGHVMEQVSLENMGKRICEVAKENR
jgi:two-component system chemotaxis response regulator CheB